MSRSLISHALGLHMHQPPGNLRLLIEANPWEAEQIIRCYERPLRYAEQYPELARLHIGFSGVLLEQLLDPDIVDRYRHVLDIPEMLQRYREARNIELVGMGCYHPIFPVIPRADWSEQLERGRAMLEQAFGRAPRGFWPPELAFTMEMIPPLVDAGFEYVVVDGVHVRPVDGVNDIFRPYLACYRGVCITIVPRDRDVSDAQANGLDPDWFEREVCSRVGASPRPQGPRLVSTWSDGENGGWFRETHESSGFFGRFFAPYLDRVQVGNYPIMPVLISQYLQEVRPTARAQVQTGAWSASGNPGLDLSRWVGTENQRAAVAEVARLSERYWSLRGRAAGSETAAGHLERARRLILEAETSCFLFWGDAWIPHLYERVEPAARELDATDSALGAATGDAPDGAPPSSASMGTSSDRSDCSSSPGLGSATGAGAGRGPLGHRGGTISLRQDFASRGRELRRPTKRGPKR